MARKEAPGTEEPTQQPEAVPDGAVAEEMDGTNLPAHRPKAVLGAVTGESGAGDFRLPRLQIAYGVGDLAATFNPGDLVLGGDTLLVHKGEPLKLIVLSAVQYWKEYPTQEMREARIMPRVFATAAEVQAAGGTTEWINGVGPTYSRAMDLNLLILKPKDIVSGLFGVKLDATDAEYAPAIFSVDKTAYQKVGTKIQTAANFSLRERGLLSGLWQLSTTSEKKKNGNMIIVPVFGLCGHNTDEQVTNIQKLFMAAQ